MSTQPFAEIDQPFDKSVTRIVLPKRIDDLLVMVDEINSVRHPTKRCWSSIPAPTDAGAASSRRPHPTCLRGRRVSRPEPSVHRSTLEQQYPKMDRSRP